MAYLSPEDLLSLDCPECGYSGCLTEQRYGSYYCTHCKNEIDSDVISEIVDERFGFGYDSDDEENQGLIGDIDDFI